MRWFGFLMWIRVGVFTHDRASHHLLFLRQRSWFLNGNCRFIGIQSIATLNNRVYRHLKRCPRLVLGQLPALQLKVLLLHSQLILSFGYLADAVEGHASIGVTHSVQYRLIQLWVGLDLLLLWVGWLVLCTDTASDTPSAGRASSLTPTALVTPSLLAWATMVLQNCRRPQKIVDPVHGSLDDLELVVMLLTVAFDILWRSLRVVVVIRDCLTSCVPSDLWLFNLARVVVIIIDHLDLTLSYFLSRRSGGYIGVRSHVWLVLHALLVGNLITFLLIILWSGWPPRFLICCPIVSWN